MIDPIRMAFYSIVFAVGVFIGLYFGWRVSLFVFLVGLLLLFVFWGVKHL